MATEQELAEAIELITAHKAELNNLWRTAQLAKEYATATRLAQALDTGRRYETEPQRSLLLIANALRQGGIAAVAALAAPTPDEVERQRRAREINEMLSR